jgi:hypothetical protein
MIKGKKPITLPAATVIGDAITFVREKMASPGGLGKKYTFSGSILFDRMKEKGTYTTDSQKIASNIAGLGLTDLFLTV